MATYHYEHEVDSVFNMYGEVCEWFSELGFTYSKTRYGIYKKYFNNFISAAKNEEVVDDFLEFKKSFDNAYIEANEIIRIHRNLKEMNSSEFIDQIKKIVSGQEFRANSNDDQARDFLFELSVAARFIKAGYKVNLTGICDVVVDLGLEGSLFVECKRIKSNKRLADNVKKANKQIVKRLKSSKSSKVKGLVAVNITDLIPKPTMLAPDSSEAGTMIHRGVSNNFVRARIHEFVKGKSKNCLGVMCESVIMHYLSERSLKAGFIYSRHTEYLPYSNNDFFELLAAKISNQDII